MISHKFSHVTPEGTTHSTSVKIYFYTPFIFAHYAHMFADTNYAQYYARVMYTSLLETLAN